MFERFRLSGWLTLLRPVCVQRTSPELVRPHAASLLKALFSVVRTEKSAAVRKACAAAAAGVAKTAAPARFSKFVVDTCQLYDQPGDVEARTASALLLRELSRQANEALKDVYVDVLPLAFVGKEDEEKDVRAMLGEVWEENTSSVATALQVSKTGAGAAGGEARQCSWNPASGQALLSMQLMVEKWCAVWVNSSLGIDHVSCKGLLSDQNEAPHTPESDVLQQLMFWRIA